MISVLSINSLITLDPRATLRETWNNTKHSGSPNTNKDLLGHVEHWHGTFDKMPYSSEVKEALVLAASCKSDETIPEEIFNKLSQLDKEELVKLLQFHSEHGNPRGDISHKISEDLTACMRNTDFQKSLIEWCNEAIGTDEYSNRIIAVRKIKECYQNKNKKLELLTLELTTLPSSIGKLAWLETLDLRDNLLTTIPDSLGKLSKLGSLYLNNNQLTTIPDSLSKLSQLITLTLNNNQLTTIPDSLSKLSQLITLTLNNNQLTTIPDSLGNLSQLRELYLYNNRLTTIPDSLGNLSQLICLYLAGNRLTTIPDSLGNLSQLSCLYLDNNRLTTIPDSLGNLSQLIILGLSNNLLTIIPDSLGNLSQLSHLYLNYNRLTIIPNELARLQSSCVIYARSTRMVLTSIQAFQAEIARVQRENPDLGPTFQFSIYEPPVISAASDFTSLEQALSFWQNQFQKTLPSALEPIESPELDIQSFYAPLLSHSNQGALLILLQKMTRTEDFKNPATKENVIFRANRTLKDACTNEVFREELFLFLENATSTCGDSATLGFDDIEIIWRIHCGAEIMDNLQLAELRIGCVRKDILDRVSREQADTLGLGDYIETLLYYQTKLKSVLKLPISAEGMLYPAMSGISDQMLEKTKTDILSQTSSFDQIVKILTHSKDSEVWIERIKKQNQEVFAEIDADILKQMMQIPERKVPEGALYHPETKAKTDALMELKEKKTRELVLQFTRDFVNRNRLELGISG